MLFLFFLLDFMSCYLPGAYPTGYKVDGRGPALKVTSMTSSHGQLPFGYYDLAFCQPGTIKDERENLGEFLMGDRIQNSVFNFTTLKDEYCRLQCDRKTLVPKEVNHFIDRIEDSYYANWILDGLPAISVHADGTFSIGFPIGYVNEVEVEGSKEGMMRQWVLNNHVDITISYNKDPATDEVYIVFFGVNPASRKYAVGFAGGECAKESNEAVVLSRDMPTHVAFTYSVVWKELESVTWATRWDQYDQLTDSEVHWFSIIESLMVVLILSAMVAMIMLRTVHADVQRYHELESAEEAQEETGWKLVHGDVFRSPEYPMMLSVALGTGSQVLAMVLSTLVFAFLGFLSPESRGALVTVGLLLWVLMALVAGFVSAYVYKMLKGKQWKLLALATAFGFPGVIAAVWIILDALVWLQSSSGAVPFGTLFQLLVLWFGVSAFLTFVGAFYGTRCNPPEAPVRVHQIPRQVPPQVWYMRPWVNVLLGSILPFAAVLIELFFIMNSIWRHQLYLLFGFLFVIVIILLITCAEISIVTVYFQLCAEDYHWWWRAFLSSGCSAVHMFLFSMGYFVTLGITHLVSSMLFFGYTFIFSLLFFLMTGTTGFFATFLFLRKIYSSVHID